MNKRSAIITTSTVIILGALGGVAAMTTNKPQAGADTSPVTTQLLQQQDELKNHEARITNTENKVTAVAKNTGTDTTTVVQIPVPAPVETAAVSSSLSTPVTTTAYQQVPIDNSMSLDCLLTYSDGSTHQWHWTIINPNGAWTLDSNGPGGHWSQTSQVTGSCDASVVGTVKGQNGNW